MPFKKRPLGAVLVGSHKIKDPLQHAELMGIMRLMSPKLLKQ